MRTTEFLRAVGDTVQHVKETVVNDYALEDWLKQLSADAVFVTPKLPLRGEGTAFYARKGPREILVIEQPPQVRHVQWLWFDDEDKRRYGETYPTAELQIANPFKKFVEIKTYAIALPYVVFVIPAKGGVILSDECYAFARTAPLQDLKDTLFLLPITNVSSDGRVCFGHQKAEGSTGAQRAASLAAGFWTSTFNTDLNQTMRATAARHPAFQNPASWEAASRENSLFPLSVNYLSPEKNTVEAFLKL